MEKEIIEGNKNIALFMGYSERFDLRTDGQPMYQRPDENGNVMLPCFYSGESEEFPTLQYHTSWDWLMPVVEKIERWNDEILDVWIVDKECDISFSTEYNIKGEDYHAPSFRQKGSTKIEACYKSVVQFIRWYNSLTSYTK